MRRVRFSATARRKFRMMIAEGVDDFGFAVADEKRRKVVHTLTTFLAERPQIGFYHRRRKFYHYPIDDTPYRVVYEFDDTELRVIFITHKRANVGKLDASSADW